MGNDEELHPKNKQSMTRSGSDSQKHPLDSIFKGWREMRTIPIRDFIEKVKADLREAADTDPMFYIDEVELDLTLTVEKSDVTKAGFEIGVSLAGERVRTKQRTQNIKVKFKPINRALTPQDLLNIAEIQADPNIGEDIKGSAKKIMEDGKNPEAAFVSH